MGYSESVCILFIDQREGTFEIDTLEFRQTHRCFKKLEEFSNITERKIEFDGNRNVISIKNELIKNLDEINCPMTCELRNNDCISLYK